MWQVLGYQVAHVDQCKGEQSLNLCGNLDGDLEHAEQISNVNPFCMADNLVIILKEC